MIQLSVELKLIYLKIFHLEQVSDEDQQHKDVERKFRSLSDIHSHVTAANIWDVVVNAKKQTIYFLTQ